MRKTLTAKALLAASALAVIAAPIAAEARPQHRYLVCNTRSGIRRNANNGALIGAVVVLFIYHAIVGRRAL